MLLPRSQILARVLSASNRNMASLPTILEELEAFAPLKLAEKWDNVGLLIEPSARFLAIEKVLLTNDLTERVMHEAKEKNVNMIISYHPPIFASLKRITQDNWKGRIVTQCLENQISLFSPHTSWDAVEGGVNDWLFSVLNVSSQEGKAILCPDPVNSPMVGGGRVYKLTGPASLGLVMRNLKKNAQLDNVQLALVDNTLPVDETMINTIALCAGSGGSVLKDVPADLYITGEMSHHEVLDAVHSGTNVILTNHSNSERGFLTKFKEIIGGKLPDVEFIVSEQDEDPLKSVGQA